MGINVITKISVEAKKFFRFVLYRKNRMNPKGRIASHIAAVVLMKQNIK